MTRREAPPILAFTSLALLVFAFAACGEKGSPRRAGQTSSAAEKVARPVAAGEGGAPAMEPPASPRPGASAPSKGMAKGYLDSEGSSPQPEQARRLEEQERADGATRGRQHHAGLAREGRQQGGREGEERLARDPSTRDGKSATNETTGTPAKPAEKKPVRTWKRAEATPNASRLMVGDREELPLKGMQVHVRVDGFRARVVLDCFYLNDRGQQLEGTFKLRVPDEASPYFFAFGEAVYKAKDPTVTDPQMDSAEEAGRAGDEPAEIVAHRQAAWSAPKEARMVPREKAAYAYHDTVRRAVDPALLEWAGAGIFSARVFPLAPGKLHRIVIGYDVQLVRAGEDLEYRLDLPSAVPALSVHLDLAPGAGLTDIKAEATSDASGRSHYHFAGPKERTFSARLKAPGPLLLTGSDPKTGPYFAAAFKPALPAGGPAAGADSAVFLVDVSLSSNPERMNVWLKLLGAILERNRPALKRFAVLCFNVETFWWKAGWSDNTPKSAQAFAAFARTLALEGATDVGAALAEAVHPAWMPKRDQPVYDLFLLSDGAATWGEPDVHALAARLRGAPGPLFAYSTGLSGTDTRILGHLARESGGAVFGVAGEAEVQAAATAHRSRPWQIAGIALEEGGGEKRGSDLLLAGRPLALYPGQALVLAGRGAPAAGAEIALTLRRDGNTEVVRTKLGAPLASHLAVRAYGEIATGQLEELALATEELSRAYATHFRVTGQTCSLLMLESEADYQRYNIKPEEDAFVVKSKPAVPALEEARKQIGDALGDPKAAFLAWIKKLEKMPGMKFEIPAAFKIALESMPRAAFEVNPGALAARERTWKAIPGALQEQLASRRLDYDALSAEAARRRKDFSPTDALKALSSLVENAPGDGVMARDVAYSALELGLGGQAYHLFRRVAASRPYEPQTYQALALCLEQMGQADLALAYYEVGLTGTWDARFGDFRQILGLEYLRFLRRLAAGQAETTASAYARSRLDTVSREFKLEQADLRIVITWNTDGTDVDLHVIEPSGEECFYSHRQTRIGGQLTQDVTQGYGPEMYTLPRAQHGSYQVRVKYFSSNRNRASTRTKVYATIYQDWGTPREKVTRKVVALADRQEMHDIGAVKIEK